MCGIAGIVSLGSNKFDSNISNMIKVISHRGPDQQGFYIDQNVALGHARLSIVDINHGKQPIKSTKTNNIIILNGEIYGYKSIRTELEKDYNFQTQTDTEVVLALYDKYGLDMMDKVPGMFSFAIWDPNNNRIFAARDRFGEKPFFYAISKNNQLIFASEIKAIIASGLIEPIVDPEVAGNFLTTMYVNPYQTIYKNIHILPQAHQLIFSLDNKQIKLQKYWQMPKLNQKITIDEAIEQFDYLLNQSVKKQLVADVEVSAFLSGGLDSSSIVAVASQYTNKLRTISFGFSDKNDVDVKNELKYSSAVAEMYNTNHISIEDKEANFAELFLKIVDLYDEPFGDSSAIPTYLISKEAVKYAKVVLTGDGADELLAGYTWIYRPIYSLEKNKKDQKLYQNWRDYLALKLIKKQKKILRLFGKNSANIESKIANLSYLKNQNNLNISHYHAQGRYGFGFIENLANLDFVDSSFKQSSSNFKGNFVNSYNFIDKDYGDENINLDDILRLDISDYMVGDILVKVDRATMANSLEARAPFLDVDLASFCISLPYQLKIDNDRDKLIMRMALENKWPKSIKNRAKQGFGSPIRRILNSAEFNKITQDFLLDKNNKIFNLINYQKTQSMINQQYNILAEKQPQFLWNLLSLAVWFNKKSKI